MRTSALAEVRLILSSLGLRTPATYLLKRMGHVDHFYFLTAPIARLTFARLRSDLRFDRATDADIAEITGTLDRLDLASRKELLVRRQFYRKGFRECYVGRDVGGRLVSIQWLVRPADNERLRKHFPGLYYPLGPGEVMLENVFIFPEFRGLGVFPTVNHHVIGVARREGFRACTAYIRKDNLVSLNAFMAMGFRMQKMLTGYNVAGRSWRDL